jgi:hypothetical protein
MSVIYFVEQYPSGYAVIGRGNDRSANIDLTKLQADRRAHDLAGIDGYVGWKGLDGKFKYWCGCSNCVQNRR